MAGYDVSRALAGSLGTLGLIVDVSLKVLPRPVAEATLRFSMAEAAALHQLNVCAGQPLPVSASAWRDGVLRLRLSGAKSAVDAATVRLGGERLSSDVADAFWRGLRDHTDAFFQADAPLWRRPCPPMHCQRACRASNSWSWGGAQRWLCSVAPAKEIRACAELLGGHATLFGHGERDSAVFHPLPAALMALQRNLKNAFDPGGVLNPGRLYEGL